MTHHHLDFTRAHSSVVDVIEWSDVPDHRLRTECLWVTTTILVAGLVVAAAGAGLSTYAASEQAAAQRRQRKSEAKFREAEAESQRQSAAFEERQFRRRIALLIGRNTATAAASGLDPTMGSPFDLELDTARQAELEALNIRRTGAVRAGASDFEASLARRAASFGPSTALTVGSGLASAASSTSSILRDWYRPKGSTGTEYYSAP